MPAGFDVAVATKACELTGLTCEMVPMVVADRIPKLKDGSVDMLFAGGCSTRRHSALLAWGLAWHACSTTAPGWHLPAGNRMSRTLSVGHAHANRALHAGHGMAAQARLPPPSATPCTGLTKTADRAKEVLFVAPSYYASGQCACGPPRLCRVRVPG